MEEKESLPPTVNGRFEDTDLHDPHEWPTKRRIFITIILCVDALIFMISSSIMTPAIPIIAAELRTNRELATLAFSFFIMFSGLTPLVLSPLSEVYGRNFVYMPCWSLYLAFLLGCALQNSIQALIVCRIFAGAFGSVMVSVPSGTISDIWKEKDVGVSLGAWVTTAYLGPALGPLLGGYITEFAGWRWVFWVSLIASGVGGIPLLWLPETRGHIIMARVRSNQKRTTFLRAASRSTVDWKRFFFTSLWRPLRLLFTEPIVLLMTLYISLVNGILNLYFASYPIIFNGLYSFSVGKGGLAFVPIGFGLLLYGITAGPMNRYSMKKIDSSTTPERRLFFAIPGSILMPISIFWFTFTANGSIPAVVPILSGLPFGWSLLIIMVRIIATNLYFLKADFSVETSLLNYLGALYRNHAASVIAGAGALRSIFAAIFPLVAEDMYTRLTPRWAGTLLGCLTVLFIPVPFLFYKYGVKIRSKSRYQADEI